MTSLLAIVAAIISVGVIALLMVEFYQMPIMGVAIMAVGAWLGLWAMVVVWREWGR